MRCGCASPLSRFSVRAISLSLSLLFGAISHRSTAIPGRRRLPPPAGIPRHDCLATPLGGAGGRSAFLADLGAAGGGRGECYLRGRGFGSALQLWGGRARHLQIGVPDAGQRPVFEDSKFEIHRVSPSLFIRILFLCFLSFLH